MLDQLFGEGKRAVAASRPAPSSQQWALVCASRLIELRPHASEAFLRATALEMAATLGYFDPTLAAEMEHEAGVFDD